MLELIIEAAEGFINGFPVIGVMGQSFPDLSWPMQTHRISPRYSFRRKGLPQYPQTIFPVRGCDPGHFLLL